jgi:glucose/arabinose dehydrogenase
MRRPASLVFLVATLPALFAGEPAARAPERLVAELCATCHGTTLSGGAGPNLLDDFWNHPSDDASLERTIRQGWPESGMPPLAGVVSDDEIKALVAYLRVQRQEFAAGRITLPPAPPDVTLKSERHSFRLETVVANLDTPWGLAFLPDGRMLVTERPGRLRIVERGQLLPAPVTNTPAVFIRQDGGLFDVALHPNHATNGWIYLALAAPGPTPDTSMTVVVRGKIRNGRWTDQQDVFRAAPDHYFTGYTRYGGRLRFDRDGRLYFSLGDRGRQDAAQTLASPWGKIHRVMDNGQVPPDNPLASRAGAMKTIFAYGLRNVQGIAFQPGPGSAVRLWASDHGPTGGDELNRIEPGKNYGWPAYSPGTDALGKAMGTPKPDYETPKAVWTPAIAPGSIEFYTGDRFPGWKNQLFVSGLIGAQLRRIELEGDKVIREEIVFKDQGRVRTVLTGPDGLLYILFNSPGRIARLVPMDDAAQSK